ncbi:MAG: hypothetical protein ACR2K5_16320 [Pseudolabrys sp.]
MGVSALLGRAPLHAGRVSQGVSAETGYARRKPVGEKFMKRAILLIAVATLAVGINARPSEAAAAWKCGKKRCFWVADYSGPVPDFAANWGPPEHSACYYVFRRLAKRWAQVCPSLKPLQ